VCLPPAGEKDGKKVQWSEVYEITGEARD